MLSTVKYCYCHTSAVAENSLVYTESADGYLSCSKALTNVGIRNITQTKFSYSIKIKQMKLFGKKKKAKTAYVFSLINSKNICNPLTSFSEQVLTLSKSAYTDVIEGIEMGLNEWGSSPFHTPESWGLLTPFLFCHLRWPPSPLLSPTKGAIGCNSSGMWHLSPTVFQGD